MHPCHLCGDQSAAFGSVFFPNVVLRIKVTSPGLQGNMFYALSSLDSADNPALEYNGKKNSNAVYKLNIYFFIQNPVLRDILRELDR